MTKRANTSASPATGSCNLGDPDAPRLSDFNDLALVANPDKVRRQVAQALPAATNPQQRDTRQRATAHATALVAVDLGDFLARDIPPREHLLAPILQEQSLGMVYARRGVGKTQFTLGLAYAVASGGVFLGWQAPEPRRVLYVDGEMPAASLQQRCAQLVKASAKEPPRDYLRLATPDLQPCGMPDLALLAGQDAVDEMVHPDTALIVVDNLSSLVRWGGSENDAESWLAVSEWALLHRAAGRAILFVHHAGKSGQQRGTSKREDLLDLVLALRHPSDYDPSQGARFELHYEKARGLYGADVDPFEARLITGPDGAQTWETRPLENSTYERAIDLHGLGLSMTDIARELEVHKSTISRALQRAQHEGRIETPKRGKK